MIVPDVNLLVYAMDEGSEQHEGAARWWQAALQGDEYVGLTWSVVISYLRLATNPRRFISPFTVAEAVGHVRTWLAFPRVRLLVPREEHLHVLERLLDPVGRAGDVIPDAHIAALAIEHGGSVYSADRDFGRFDRLQWVNPLAEPA